MILPIVGESGIDPNQRTILHIDVDCFEVQVWLQRSPQFKGLPCVTVNPPSRITCVNYPARHFQITRDTPLRTALRKCPCLQVFVNDMNAQEDVDPWRMANTASWDIRDVVLDSLQALGIYNFNFEYLSKDEFFIDISNYVNETDLPENVDLDFGIGIKVLIEDEDRKLTAQEALNLHLVRYSESMKKLIHGGLIGKSICDKIYRRLGYECSVGVSNNKILAKLGCGLNKPYKVTVLPHYSLQRVSPLILLEKVPGLGGVLGREVYETLSITRMNQLSSISGPALQEVFGKVNGSALWDLAHGIDTRPVLDKHMHSCVGCSKFFKDGTEVGVLRETIIKNLLILSFRLVDRLRQDRERHKREFTDCKLIFNTGRSTRCSTFRMSSDMTGEDVFEEAQRALAIYDYQFRIQWTYHISEMRLLCRESIDLTYLENSETVSQLKYFFKSFWFLHN